METIVAAGEGARAFTELMTWVDVAALACLLYGASQWVSQGWKKGATIIAGTAIVYALAASLAGLGAIGRMLFSIFGVTV